MIPTTPILAAIPDLLANDTATLNQAANALHVHLAMAPFSPNPNLVPGDFTEATFVGSAAKSAGLNAAQNFTDPTTGVRIVQLNEPAGGWHWQCTVTPGAPQIVYGYWVTDNTDADVYGSALLPVPITIGAAGQAIDVPYIRFTFANGSPS